MHGGGPVTGYGSSTVKRRRRSNVELDVIDEAILVAVRDEHPVSLRGVYYRVVSAGAVDKTEAGYRLVGRQLLKLRQAGVVPYSWITDGTRYVIRPETWRDHEAALRHTASTYRQQLWWNQPVDVQMFTEKDAITGVIEDVTYEWDVPLGVLRGYASESFCWKVSELLPRHKPTILYQLGDHDPSGVDAWRSFAARVTEFAPDKDLTFERLAVTPEQITAWSLPTRPTKRTDSRAGGFDGGSIEVDAIPPSRLRSIVREAIERHIDPQTLELTQAVEQSERDLLTRIAGGDW